MYLIYIYMQRYREREYNARCVCVNIIVCMNVTLHISSTDVCVYIYIYTHIPQAFIFLEDDLQERFLNSTCQDCQHILRPSRGFCMLVGDFQGVPKPSNIA